MVGAESGSICVTHTRPGPTVTTGLSFFLSTILASLKVEHYARECEFWNFDKIKKQNKKNPTKTGQIEHEAYQNLYFMVI